MMSVLQFLVVTNISPVRCTFEDDSPFPMVGYVRSLEGNNLLRIEE